MCFCGQHQLSLLGGRPSSEQVWKGLQCWPPDVSGMDDRPQVWCPVEYPAMWPSSWCICCYLPHTPIRMTDRHLWKRSLPATSFAASKYLPNQFINILQDLFAYLEVHARQHDIANISFLFCCWAIFYGLQLHLRASHVKSYYWNQKR